MAIAYIVTHPGPAHRDDLLACAVLLASQPEIAGIYRRDPTALELDDPVVCIVDVGGRHECALHNFDHHQFSRDASPSCALTLVLDYLGIIETARDALLWLSATETLDSKGPFAWSKDNGVAWDVVQPLVSSPVEGWLLKEFSSFGINGVSSEILKILRAIGGLILETVREFADRRAALDLGAKKIDGYGGFVIVDARCIDRRDRPVFGLEAWCKHNAPEAAITITQDDRGEGFCLFRRNDDPRVDFSRCEGMTGVVFAHKNGFVLKTTPDADVFKLIEIVFESKSNE